jgi:hypothetical protein
MSPTDRRTRVLESTSFNGIDFIEVSDDQRSLRVHFLNSVGGIPGEGTVSIPEVAASQPPPMALALDSPPVTITGGESIPTVPVSEIENGDWSLDGTHLVLALTVAFPGDFSNYTLTIKQKRSLPPGSPPIDSMFASASFSFKAHCPSNLDCQPAPVVCPPLESDVPPIDYLAKDFLSFRQALLDFSALRYPEWQERSEADFGVMFLEALCAVADDLSYTQDRIAAEAALETATQRRSVVRLARLIDYEPGPALAASTWLQFNVSNGIWALADGLPVTAVGPDGTPVSFETGTTLANRLINPVKNVLRSSPPTSTVNSAWNRGAILPYCWFDESQQCLPAGATQMYVLGSGFNFFAGQPLLIETAPASPAGPPIRQIVQLLDGGTETCDPLFPPPEHLAISPPTLTCADFPGGTAVTLIKWGAQDALSENRDLSKTILAGNLIKATQGLTRSDENFFIPPFTSPPLGMPAAIVRTGPNDSPANPSLQCLYTLGFAPLAWLPPEEATGQPQPEIVLQGQPPEDTKVVWGFVRSLLEAGPFDSSFTVDAARYAPIAGTIGNSLNYDYDGDAGDTLRFGDDVFGASPEPAAIFTATYRSGGGSVGNVAADSITSFDPSDPRVVAAHVVAVTNPMQAAGGLDPESIQSIQRLAPLALQAAPYKYRAVLPSDYQAAAGTLPWVKRAGTAVRWTGSWLTVFTTPDPLNSEQVTADQRQQLIELLNRRRLAGYESYVNDPNYVALDLVVQACALPDAFQGAVEQAVLHALSSSPGGFFDPNNFTFGKPLEQSALQAVVQRASGVAGVTEVLYRVRGRTTTFIPMGDTVTVGVDQIIRCDNDPSLPDHGTLQVIIEGGR